MICSILIHVGYHKTATTWLQNRLFAEESGLGFTSPWGRQAGLAVDAFVVQNPFRFDAGRARELFLPGIAEASRKSCVPVLSNEAMCGMEGPRLRYEKQVIDRLYEALPEGKILITIRRQKESILSHYREAIARGETYSISEYLNKSAPKPGFAAPCQIDHFEYDLLVRYCMELFGKESVLVLLQEELKDNRQAFCDRLFEFSGLASKPVSKTSHMRLGNAGTGLIYRKWCNTLNLGVRKPGFPNRLSSRIVNKVGHFVEAATPAFMSRKIEEGLNQAVDDMIGGYFKDSNARLQSVTGLDLRRWGYELPDL